MVSISLCMIVKNEENSLPRCLDSIKDIVDEIIIVDTGSTDKTKKIASYYTTKIFDFKWSKDFSKARNYSFSKATQDYILWLDGDDVVLKPDRAALLQLKKNINPDVDVVKMNYNVDFDELGYVTGSYYTERLLKRSKYFKWKEPVHEYLIANGKILNSNINITHEKDNIDHTRNLKLYEYIRSLGDGLSTRSTYYYAAELYFNKNYERAIVYYKKFLNTNKGSIEENIGACLALAECYSIIKDKKNELKYLLETFTYDIPRAETCCQLGYFYKATNEYAKAVFWFGTALSLEKDEHSTAYIKHDYFDYIPSVELCLCYFQLGDINEAIKYNNSAGQIKPGDKIVKHNSEFLKKYTIE